MKQCSNPTMSRLHKQMLYMLVSWIRLLGSKYYSSIEKYYGLIDKHIISTLERLQNKIINRLVNFLKIISFLDSNFKKKESIVMKKYISSTIEKLQKKILNFQLKPPSRDIVMFIRLSADLLREKMEKYL